MTEAVPDLRFPEFPGKWKAGHAGDAFAKGAAKGSAGLPIYSVTMDRGLVPRDSLERHMADDAADGTNLRAEPNDIVYNTMRMWQGAAGVADIACMVSPAYVVLRPKQGTVSTFFGQRFGNSKMLHFLWAYSHGLTSDRLRLYFDDFAQIPVHIPSSAEQQKIADFLGTVDAKLGALRRKKSGLEAFKSGLMQRLFSQELRFTRDDGSEFPDWEEVRIGELVDLISGQHLSPDQYSSEQIGIPYFSGPSDFTNSPDRNDKWSKSPSAKIAKSGDALITVKGSSVGMMMRLKLPQIAMGRQLMAIRSAHASSGFVYHYLLTKQHELKARAAGNMIPGLSRDDILSLSAACPTDQSEQHKIADVLSTMDAKITAVADQISHMETFKKGLLQQMFV